MGSTLVESQDALTGVAQLAMHCPSKQKASSSIPGQGTCVDCRIGPQAGCVREATDVSLLHRCFYPCLPLSLPSL